MLDLYGKDLISSQELEQQYNVGRIMKHVGKTEAGSKVVVLYRTIPGDANSCLVVGPNFLEDSRHDTLMAELESERGQQSNELAEYLAVRKFRDGSVILEYLHANNFIKKYATKDITMTPTTNGKYNITLDKLNEEIAEQKGIKVEDLAVQDKASKRSDVVSGTTTGVTSA
jgi:hypothetical protein